MAAQRQPTGRPTTPTSAHSHPNPTPTGSPRQNAAVELQDKPMFQPEDEEAKRSLQRESERQTWFQSKANEYLNIPNGYLKVAVLIIRWHEGIDEFKEGHDQEIARLQGILETKFNYQCDIARLENSRNPQVDLKLEILQHIRKHDGPNNLLIIYYTGHGQVIVDHDESRLELSATHNAEQRKGAYIPTAFWDKAEAPLKEDAVGDVLSILDCCFASSAALKNRAEEFRTYQLLAASAVESPTNEPGKNSFTTALIDSLEELLDEYKKECFPVTKLVEKINMKRTRSPALIWDRLRRYKRNVNLAPLDPKPTQERERSFQGGDPERSSLSLRLSLTANDLTKKQIESLAEHLPHACRKSKVPIRQIDWVKMETTRRPSRSFRGVVAAISAGYRFQRMSGMGNIGKEQPDGSLMSPVSLRRKRERGSGSSLSRSKRHASSSDGTLLSTPPTPISPRSSGTVGDGRSSSE
ncbi:uncharacterized protein BDR25DRAFT_253097 [Lindgomyces ingoldianus]|uniref:Uncharacterized protein n=1 Tax=Lindgomyces ingoldianus TaxID=673940 RepID=A0ACB6R8L0_9PLEO|nr:uncharacterized protein BDR25DRAFT_253097 [Lindgomyces ingoldianus]KAF2475654.1 hypothetical protein BDR25DRAFT_253097 [Lindgomyces ingoldianus]